MGTSITIAEFLIISFVTVIGYVVIKAVYETWFK
jgi:hypothetical protein